LEVRTGKKEGTDAHLDPGLWSVSISHILVVCRYLFLLLDLALALAKCEIRVAICIGLWTYGYNIMKNLGNRITLMSPSRGFSMELASSITVIMATRLALPVSTTQVIVGAIMGVALCNGDLKALNWRMVM
jgi:phosphate/sulfate permease